jgi:enoyl-CoA hydratase/carnithine racemase
MSEVFQTEAKGHVRVVTFERPPSNFVDPNTLERLADLLEAFDAEADCRAVVLQAAGKVFCAGADLAANEAQGPSRPQRSADDGNPLYDQAVRLFATRKPIIAAIQGPAIGAGVGLALIADFRIASPEARFGATFTRLGFHPGFGLSYTLPRLIGSQAAANLLLTARRIAADEAAAIGLVDRIAPRESLRSDALGLAEQIAENAPLAVQATRATLRGDLATRVRAQTDLEWAAQRENMKSADFSEGVSAMAERRTPVFAGR